MLKAASALPSKVQLAIGTRRRPATPLRPFQSADVLRFTRAQRLLQKSQFDAVYKNGRRVADPCFMWVARPNGLEHARLGLAIAARAVGNAVNRNRIKRVIRESFRLHQDSLAGLDIIVNSREGARDAENKMLVDCLARGWREIVKRCAPF